MDINSFSTIDWNSTESLDPKTNKEEAETSNLIIDYAQS